MRVDNHMERQDVEIYRPHTIYNATWTCGNTCKLSHPLLLNFVGHDYKKNPSIWGLLATHTWLYTLWRALSRRGTVLRSVMGHAHCSTSDVIGQLHHRQPKFNTGSRVTCQWMAVDIKDLYWNPDNRFKKIFIRRSCQYIRVLPT